MGVAIALSMTQHFIILYIPFLAVSPLRATGETECHLSGNTSDPNIDQ